jgi:hypothetical protein
MGGGRELEAGLCGGWIRNVTTGRTPVRTLDEVFAVCRFMAAFAGPWWIAGGWAADIWLGRKSREHEDIEIGVRRCDQAALHDLCAGWEWFTPVNDQWAPLPDGELLEHPRFMLQVRRVSTTSVSVHGMPPEFEFLLNEVEGDEWYFSRDRSIHLPLARVHGPSPLGVPVVAPEVLLLHKPQQRWRRPKDEHDFRILRAGMSAGQRAWLREQFERLRPDAPWLSQLLS